MKLSTRILLSAIILMISGLLLSDVMLKKEYDSLNKSDSYWNFNTILEKPFKHLHISGGNGTHIIYEPSSKPSLRLLREWVDSHSGEVKAEVKNDTLYIDFDYLPQNLFEKFWMKNVITVRIFSPELLSVTGQNTNFEMQKVNQKNFDVYITGRSRFEVETMSKELDTVNIFQQDSSEVVFEVSPEYQLKVYQDNRNAVFRAAVREQTNRNESLSIKSLKADINDFSLLDIGHAQVQSMKLHVSDSAAVILSGEALRNRNNGPAEGR